MRVIQSIGNTDYNMTEEGKGIANYLQPAESAGPFPFASEIYHAPKAGVRESGSINMADATYQRPGAPDGAGDVASQLESALGMDMGNHKNQMAVLANVLSPEDLKEFQKSGFSLSDSDPKTIITVTDEIKAVLAKAGVDVSGYGDRLSVEQLEEITGSSLAAQQISRNLDTAEATGDTAVAGVSEAAGAAGVAGVSEAAGVAGVAGVTEVAGAAAVTGVTEAAGVSEAIDATADAAAPETAEQAAIRQSLEAHDLPVTEENLSEAAQAYETANEIFDLNEDAIAYLIKNQLPPSIRNLYKAAHLGGSNPESWKKEIDFPELDDQIRRILTENGVEVTEKSMEDSRWLISHDIELSKKNLLYLSNLENYVDQVKRIQADSEEPDRDFMADAMAEAVAEGRRPLDAMMITGYSLWDQAKHAAQVIGAAGDEDIAYCMKKGQEITIANLETAMAVQEAGGAEDSAASNAAPKLAVTDGIMPEDINISLITARRQLEEARLIMTVQANYALLKKGIAIDTRPLEELVEDLKEQENAYYRSLLDNAGVPATEKNVAMFAETARELAELKTYPAYILQPYETYTVHALRTSGSRLEEKLKQAGEKYETLMTAPREDLGDDIRQAFRNVDDILEDLSLETSESNRRAVRILAYNETELTEENIAAIKAVDEEVQRTFQNLTPAVTLEMIRKGINPLDMELSELNRTADEIRAELGTDDQERFSKYLWKLEHKNGITEKERETYIGIYRLIAQVEKTDGAVIGALQKQGVELTMRNLLSAVRSRKKGDMDYRIDDEFAGVEGKKNGPAIDDQIAAAYQQNCLKDAREQLTPGSAEAIADRWEGMTPEQLKESVEAANRETAEEDARLEEAYAKEQLSQFAKVLSAPEEIYTFLDKYDVPHSMENILAAERMLQNPSEMFRKLFGKDGYGEKSKLEAVQELEQKLLEEFGEAVKTPQEMADAQEALADIAERVMKAMILEERTIRASDIRELQILNKQFMLGAKRSREEESYVIPVETADGMTGVSLKVVRGTGEKGLVDLFFRGELMGKIAAAFEAKEKAITGVIATDQEETRQQLLEHLGELEASLAENGEEVQLHVTLAENLDGQQFELRHLRGQESGAAGSTQAGGAAGSTQAGGTAGSTQTGGAQEDEARSQVQTGRLYRIAERFLQSVSSLRSDK